VGKIPVNFYSVWAWSRAFSLLVARELVMPVSSVIFRPWPPPSRPSSPAERRRRFPRNRSGPLDVDPMAQDQRYPFGVNLVKETPRSFIIEPAVQGVIS
jgi:hypothetical protein